MSVVLYKNGESIKVEPRSLQAHLDQGWSTHDPNRPPPGTPDDLRLPVGSTDDEYQAAALQRMGITSERVDPDSQPQGVNTTTDQLPDDNPAHGDDGGSTDSQPAQKPKRKPGRPRKRQTSE